MKRLISFVVLTFISTNAYASDWVLPAVSSFIVGAILNKFPAPVYGGMPQVYGPGGYATVPPNTVLYVPNLLQQTYNCLVPFKDPLTGVIRNEVMVCIQ
jgi:hypothetical protein